jgi:hypothetical protein
VSGLAVAEVAKTFGIAALPKLLASFATTVIDRATLTDCALFVFLPSIILQTSLAAATALHSDLARACEICSASSCRTSSSLSGCFE